MSYTGMTFVLQYEELLDELEKTMSSEFREIIFRFRFLDPHDLVSPDDRFSDRHEMISHLAILIWIDYSENDPVHRN